MTCNPFMYAGRFYHVKDVQSLSRPIQSLRILIWVGGLWPNRPPMRPAAHWDGIFPPAKGLRFDVMLPVEEMRALIAYMRAARIYHSFDIVH